MLGALEDPAARHKECPNRHTAPSVDSQAHRLAIKERAATTRQAIPGRQQAMGCLFHRLVIVGRGLTDLDKATASEHSLPQPASQSL